MLKRFGFHRWSASILPVLLISACTAIHRNDTAEYDRASVIGGVWKLLRFDAVAGQTSFEITDPDHYTLSLLADGSYRVRADCNRMQGGYSLEGHRLTIKPGATTLAECGPDSYYGQYLRYLTAVKGLAVDETRDQLTLSADVGRLVFSKGSDVP